MSELNLESAEIRELRPSDRAEIAAMVESSSNLTREEKDCAMELVDIYLGDPGQKDYFFLTALDCGKPAGYVCYGKRPLTDAVYDLYWIVVGQSHRRKGIASILLRHTEKVLKGLGARLLIAETSGLPAYEAARSLYAVNGYGEEARIREFYKPGDDLVVYTKRLKSED